MTREQIIEAIRESARKLGRGPSLRELLRMAGISEQNLQNECGSLKHALELAGIEKAARGYDLAEDALLLDWAGVARKIGKVPTVAEYETNGRYTNSPFNARYQRWALVPQAFCRFAQKQKLAATWEDVLKMAQEAMKQRGTLAPQRRMGEERLLKDRPVYGAPLLLPEMLHEPTNELEVIFLFGALARRLGFVVRRLQSRYPDGEVLREKAPGKWQCLLIEFEHESRNYLKHGHPKTGCDLVVCWNHNWPGCPVEVLELRKAVGSLGKSK